MARKNALNRLGAVAKKNDDYEYSPWYIPATGFGIDDRFLQNVTMNSISPFLLNQFMGLNTGNACMLPGQLISPSTRRLNQISPIRNAALLKVMDEISKDAHFHIDGVKKGTEKLQIEKLYPDVEIGDDGTWSKMLLIDAGKSYTNFATKFAAREGQVTCTAEEKANLTRGNVRFATTKTWVQVRRKCGEIELGNDPDEIKSFKVPDNTNRGTIKSRVEGCPSFGFRFVIEGKIAADKYKTEVNIEVIPVTCTLEL